MSSILACPLDKVFLQEYTLIKDVYNEYKDFVWEMIKKLEKIMKK